MTVLYRGKICWLVGQCVRRDVESGRLNVGDKASIRSAPGRAMSVSGSFDRPDGGAMYYLTVTAPDGSDFGEYLTYNGRWGSPQKEYLMDTCWNAEAVLREAAGADEDWELYDSRLIQDDGIPYVCFRLEARRSNMRWSRRTARASMPPSSTQYGSLLYYRRILRANEKRFGSEEAS